MKSFLPRLVLLALSAVLLTPATGHAWQHAKRGGCNAGDPELPFAHKWRTLPVPYKIDTGSFATEGASTLAVTGTDAAFAEWTARTDSDFAVMNVGTTSATRLGNGDNEIFWLQTSWDATTGTDGNTLALTFTISDRRTGNS
ncbi:MAG: hypothetical protein KC417_12100, partial [Myxococcales bacterium]|nr:hypothetical protein [Myxococcales bacterium]